MNFEVNEELHWINPQGGVVSVFFRGYTTKNKVVIELIRDQDTVLADETDLFRSITEAKLERGTRSEKSQRAHTQMVERVLIGMT